METEPQKGIHNTWKIVATIKTEIGHANGVIILRQPEMTVTQLHLLNQGLGDQIQLPSVLANKVLLKHSHVNLFTYCL